MNAQRILLIAALSAVVFSNPGRAATPPTPTPARPTPSSTDEPGSTATSEELPGDQKLPPGMPSRVPKAVPPSAKKLPPAAERNFIMTYKAVVKNIPSTAKTVDVWIPFPKSSPYQTIAEARVTAPVPVETTQDPRTGNVMLHLRTSDVTSGAVDLAVEYRVRRREHVRKDFHRGSGAVGKFGSAEFDQYLKAERLVPLDDKVRKVAGQAIAGKSKPLDRARAIYNYVLSNMTYDKTGTGWGNGDIHWACDAKRGNCTDFHALFIGLCRAAGIPARFVMGIGLPTARGEGDIDSYHCWAEFFLAGYGWVPVDVSEASKDPKRIDYFFGANDENRVQLSTGRDLSLVPPQRGDALNYFIYPYVEVDGTPHADVTHAFHFRDVTEAMAREELDKREQQQQQPQPK
jgi:transglutaminase-like putative cysteine protease